MRKLNDAVRNDKEWQCTEILAAEVEQVESDEYTLGGKGDRETPDGHHQHAARTKNSQK